MALVALGGYGRGELAPASDIDLMLLHSARDPGPVRTLAETLFYPLWDSGFTVGNAVRTPKECGALASERLDVATAMLDARLLAGDESLFAEMRERVLSVARKQPAAFTGKLWAAAAERRARFGSVSHLLEPDVKEGAGGLRDIHSLGWAAAVAAEDGLRGLEKAGFLRALERDRLEAAEEYLVRLRSALHLETGRKTDRVHLDTQPGLATALGFEDEPGLSAVDGLMRATFEHARAVEHVTEAAFGRILGGSSPPPSESSDAFEPTPEGVIGVFARAASTDGVVPPALLDAVEAVELPDQVSWTAEVRDSFLAILRSGDGGVIALEAMDRAGLLAPYLPEWGPVRCRPQRDPYHRYTVDVHLLETVAGVVRELRRPAADDPVAAQAAALVTDVDGLVLGALLHDIGKTGHGGHVATGSRAAAAALDRMGVSESARALAQFLVESHLLLSDTATRRDLEDENLVLDVAARVGDAERLAALYLLTAADARATGPHAWTPWRAALIRELVAKVQHVLERGDMGVEAAERLARRVDAVREALSGEDGVAVERFLTRMPRGYLSVVAPERVARHFQLLTPDLGQVEVRTLSEVGARPGTHSLTVVARDRPGLLARIAGALALSGLSILSAQVFTTEDGVAVDLFEVEPAFEGEVDEDRWRRFRSTLRRAVEGRLSLEYRVREKRQYYPKPRAGVPVEVHVDNEASDFFTVIEVGAADRIGLLFDITRTLFELELDVHIAKVATYGERVVDAFYVRDVLGQKVEDQEHAEEITKAITARLSE